ncbi:MAG: GLPGLI family protein [Ferruginibacter sp.]
MKKLIAALLILTSVQPAIAQVKEGKIIYEQKVDLHRRIPEDNQQMRSMIPPTRTTKFEMLFADNQSLFKAMEEEPDMAEPNNNGVVIRIGGGPENEYYKNFTTQKMADKRELMQEMYLLEDSIKSLAWKMEEGETKTIAGYPCKRATGKTERGNEVVAWYTEDIPLPAGPEQFNGLPGMILGLDVNKSEFVFTAISIDKKIDKKELKAPTKGKKVNSAEFAKIQKELMGNGEIRIIRN